ncbi:DUF4426 domain-containing protein [Aliamphritea spongicola]|uniref:DUF4426 domain-containing protein n=1 Tax=Aliamphritea spongicola TaxID=707589 RepID=UPI00196AB11A|nr:DUF4426 domain-containing protein [Aliamphritea spongicola]MBN3562344.1 DUF4426 domain-containing protein [Aliamphritea spongicola]
MKHINYFRTLAATVLALGITMFGQQALAEQKVTQGKYEVHYNAFNSTFLQPNVAQSYGIKRGKTRGLLNVSVLEKQADGSTKPVVAVVNGKATNLTSQEQALNFRQIRETNALYYIAEYAFTDDQVLRFNLQVQADPNSAATNIKFEQRFYAD